MAADRQRFYHKRDRLKQLRVFCHVALLGSITRAAGHLGLGQPTVSQRVRALETELGVRLFERNGPRIALTAAGESFYRIAMPLVEDLDGLHETFDERRERVSGMIRIAAGEGAASFMLPRLINRFRNRYPDVRFRIVRNVIGKAAGLLRSREEDLFFGGTKVDLAGIDRYRVSSFNLVLIVPLNHPLAGRESVELEEIVPYPAIAPAVGTQSRKMGELTASRLGTRINVAVEAHGWGAIKSYVEAGLGVSIVPDFCIFEQDLVSVVPLSRYFRDQGYWMYARRGKPHQSTVIGRFIRFVLPFPHHPPPPPPPEATAGTAPSYRLIRPWNMTRTWWPTPPHPSPPLPSPPVSNGSTRR